MRTLLTVFTCVSFAFFALGCYSLQPENISTTHTIRTDDDVQLKMKNGALFKWTAKQVDSVRVDTSEIAMFKGAAKDRTAYPVDSVKTLYVTKYNGFRTTVASVFALTCIVPILLLIAFPLRLG